MSVRIHQLSKKTGIASKELLSILTERGFNVTSASSSIDNISADSLVEEFASKKESEKASSVEENDAVAKKDESVKENAPSSLPPGVFVKSAEQVADEREEKLEASRPKPSAPPPIAKPPAPIPPKPSSFGPPPVSIPQSPTAVSPKNPGPSSPPPPPPIGLRPPAPANPVDKAAEGDESPEAAASLEGDDIRTVQVKPPIVVREFATAIGVKPFKLISELMEMGIFASMNQSIEETVASQVAERHGILLDVRHRGDAQAAQTKVEKKVEKKEVDESLLMEPRPPVVCILGHVDHGKTSLLDKIRSTNVVKDEAGGITQHIGAYQIKAHDKLITFLDTPGHAAFNKMRARGANVTDIAILIVAADDGFMPQTDEALLYIRNADVTPIIAINKIDTKGANVERVKTQMQERDLLPEDWGGGTITVEISALNGDGIDNLLEMILLQADVLELKANPKKKSSGIVIESQMEVGRGPTATVIVQSGTLKSGDSLVCGLHYTKVKAMFDDEGKPVKEATPSFPVRIIGWSGAPECGAVFETVKNDREAKKIVEDRTIESRTVVPDEPVESVPGTVETLFEAMAATKKRALQIVVKGDVFGSVEAVISVLGDIESSKVSLNVVHSDVGAISKSDVQVASAGEASIIGFNVRTENGVNAFAKNQGVEIQSFKVIYELVDSVRDAMADLLDPELKETKIGAAEVRQVFQTSSGAVAGCLVVEGRAAVGLNARVRRKNNVEADRKVKALRRLKDEVKEVRAGTECGVSLVGYSGFMAGDIIEFYEVEAMRASL